MSCVNHDKKYVFIHTPKCAGTSMETVPWNRLGAGHDSIYDFSRSRHLDGPSILKNYYKWAFVRNPYDRIVSAYESCPELVVQVGEFKDFIEILHSQRDKFTNLPHISWASLPKINIPINRIHFYPMSPLFMLDGQMTMDFIGKVENINEDWSFICQKFGIPDATLHNNNTRGKQPKMRNSFYKDLYNPELVQKVYEIFKEDFDNFGYSPQIKRIPL